jgi:GABA(A) receptor-associated protein
MLPFRARLTPEQRRAECERVSARRSGYVPTIVERGDRTAPRIDKEKFLIPVDLTGSQLHFVVRRRLRMEKSEALFLLCEGALVGPHTTVGELYARHRSAEDGFLYVTYTLEHAFG